MEAYLVIWDLYFFIRPNCEFKLTSKSVFVCDTLRVSARLLPAVWSVFLPLAKSPIKKPSKKSTLFWFNFSDKFSKGFGPSVAKLGYFWKGMNINQSSDIKQIFRFHHNISCFCVLAGRRGKFEQKREICKLRRNNVKQLTFHWGKEENFTEAKKERLCDGNGLKWIVSGVFEWALNKAPVNLCLLLHYVTLQPR